MSLPEIRDLVPHFAAMVLLDRVVSVDAESLCAEVIIRPESLFCREGKVGTWVGIEYMAQAIAAYAGNQARLQGQAVKVGFLLGSRRYECTRPYFLVGDVLNVYVHVMMQVENGLGSFDCHIDVDGEQIATGTLSVFQPNDADVMMAMGVANE